MAVQTCNPALRRQRKEDHHTLKAACSTVKTSQKQKSTNKKNQEAHRAHLRLPFQKDACAAPFGSTTAHAFQGHTSLRQDNQSEASCAQYGFLFALGSPAEQQQAGAPSSKSFICRCQPDTELLFSLPRNFPHKPLALLIPSWHCFSKSPDGYAPSLEFIIK